MCNQVSHGGLVLGHVHLRVVLRPWKYGRETRDWGIALSDALQSQLCNYPLQG
jgi:hypothetical protein